MRIVNISFVLLPTVANVKPVGFFALHVSHSMSFAQIFESFQLFQIHKRRRCQHQSRMSFIGSSQSFALQTNFCGVISRLVSLAGNGRLFIFAKRHFQHSQTSRVENSTFVFGQLSTGKRWHQEIVRRMSSFGNIAYRRLSHD